MSETRYDVIGIGNAIVDVLTRTDDAFLAKPDLPKGGMTLIDAGQAEALYAEMGSSIEASGGSAANTMAGLASLGSRGCFVGKVRDDQLGRIFAHDIRAIGVDFHTAPAGDGPPTARCLILITPDAQRTMNTFLGACQGLGPDDVEADHVAAARVTYLEGYLWDPPAAKEAFLKAVTTAHAAGRKVALSLSDRFCVDRWRDEFLDLVSNHVDILFANEQEIGALYRTDSFDDALAAVRGHCEVAALTRSEKGAAICAGADVHVMPAEPVDRVVDTTGAGDLYAAGFLHGYTKGLALPDCARIGAIAAAEIISHVGARPETELKTLLAGRVG